MSPPEHVLVLGATGVSGLAFIKEGLAQTPPTNMTLYVRSRSKLPVDIESHANIRVVEGTLTDEAALISAMESVTTVISFLGAYISLSHLIWRTKPTPIADSLPTVFSAMRTSGVKRIMVLSTASGFPVAGERLSWTWWVLGMIPKIITPNGNAEMKGIAEQVAGQDGFEWTIFRVPHLNDGDAGLEVAAGLINDDYKGSVQLSRGSQARWVLRELKERKWVKGAPMLGNC